jgi:16S rRNA processing protein RimM
VEKSNDLLIGKIVGAHGVKGTVKVYSYAESVSIFKPGGRITIKNTNKREKRYSIIWAKAHGKVILLSIEEITNRGEAKSFVGAKLYVEKAMLPKAEAGSCYWFDLIGLSVFTTGGEYLGQIESIFPTGSNDVYVVKDIRKDQEKETLIPALESVVLNIDFDKKTMRVLLPEGL